MPRISTLSALAALPALPSLLALSSLLALALALPSAALGCSSGAPATDPGSAASAPDAAGEDTSPGQDAGPAADGPTDDNKTLPVGGSAGCGKPGAKADYAENATVAVAGKTRVFSRYVPKAYDPYRAYRVVFVYHSGGRTGASTRPYFDLEKLAGESAIFLYPDGLDKNWDLDSQPPSNPDVAFFDALLAETASAYCVDKSRVFVTGSSMGAYMTNQLGCWRGADVIRAIAPHAGSGPYQDKGGKYEPGGHLICAAKPPAAMVFHGLADTNVKPEDGQFSAEHWRFWAGCKATTTALAPAPCTRFDGCTSPVQSCWVPGQGHSIWSEGRKATWDFFAAF